MPVKDLQEDNDQTPPQPEKRQRRRMAIIQDAGAKELRLGKETLTSKTSTDMETEANLYSEILQDGFQVTSRGQVKGRCKHGEFLSEHSSEQCSRCGHLVCKKHSLAWFNDKRYCSGCFALVLLIQPLIGFYLLIKLILKGLFVSEQPLEKESHNDEPEKE